VFLQIPDLKGIIVGGPGPTKNDFVDGEYFQYTLKDKILSIVDTAYTGEGGLDEVVQKSPEILKEVRYVEEKKLMQRFLYELGHDSGLVTYGEKEVRNALYKGLAKTLLISEEFAENRVTAQCSNCDHIEEVTIKEKKPETIQAEYAGKTCSKCSTPNLKIIEIKEVIDELAEIAEQSGAEVEVISAKTEEGAELESLGGVVAFLRYKQI
jgi:peptide chain release factor subunit 1